MIPLSLFIVVLLSSPAFAAEPAHAYRVTAFEGSAGFIPEGARRVSPLTKNLTLESGDRIVTGSGGRVELATARGTVVEVGEKSSVQVQEAGPASSSFYVKMGRFLAKFSKESSPTYRVRTPVAVAAVRGTELALAVAENGETQGGVIEGEVAFSGLDEGTPDISSPSVIAGPDTGVVIKPRERPVQVSGLPPLVVDSINRFPHIRERVISVRDQWAPIPPARRVEIRRAALREQVKWQVPPRLLGKIPPLRESVPTDLRRSPRRRLDPAVPPRPTPRQRDR